MRVDRRTALAGGLVLAIGLAAWIFFGPAEATSTQTAAPGALPRTTPGAQPAAPGTPVPVRLEALTADRDQPGEARRNPFRFQPRQAATPTGPMEPPKPGNETPPGAEVPRGPTGPPALPAIPLKFIGILVREDGTKWAVLADGRGTFHGREGMVVGGTYQILKIGTESIELAYADGRGRQTIRLTGQ